MKNAFSLSITLWISIILIAGALFFIENSKKSLTVYQEINNKTEVSIKNFSHLSLIKSYIFSGNAYLNSIKNDNYLELGLPKELRIDGIPFQFENSIITLQDAAGLVNILNFNSYQLDKILEYHNYQEKEIFLSSLIDWLDRDRLHQLNGAERYYYENNNYNYTPRDNNFLLHIQELQNIKGGENLLKVLNKDLFTYSINGGVNISTMPQDILLSYANNKETETRLMELFQLKESNISNIVEFKEQLNNLENIAFTTNFFPSKTIKIKIQTSIKNTTYTTEEVVDFELLQTLY